MVRYGMENTPLTSETFLEIGRRRMNELVTTDSVLRVFLGWLCYALSFYVLSRVVLPRFKLVNDSNELRYYLTTYFIGSCFSLFIAFISLQALQHVGNDFVNDVYPPLISYAPAGVLYFTYDLVAMFICFGAGPNVARLPLRRQVREFVIQRFDIILHHLVMTFVAIPFAVFVIYDKGHIVVATIALHEASTPFLNVYHSMKLMKKTDNWLFVCNGVVFVAAFFVFRVCAFPYLYLRYQHSKGMASVLEVPWALPWYCNAGSFLIVFLQYFWFVKIVQKLCSRLQKAEKSS